MSKIVVLKNSPSFLQRFKDKKQVIDRNGIVKLLEMKRKQLCMSISNKEKSQDKAINRQKSIYQIKKDQSSQLQLQTEPKNEKQEKRDKRNFTNRNQNLHVKIKQSFQNDGMQQKSAQKSTQLHKDLKLPQINKSIIELPSIQRNKSQNFILKHNISDSIKNNQEIKTEISQISNTMSLKLELNNFALQHLQLLNRFQRLLIDTRLSRGKKSILK